MSRTPAERLRRRLREGTAARDGGVTLIEVIVALLIFAVMTTGVVPLLVTALKAGVVAKMDTGGRNLSQQRFELIRNLPFRLQYDPANPTQHDLLDIYYPDLTPPTGGAATEPGFVTTQERREGEPSGSFYRTRWDVSFNGGDYTQWVAVQFLEPRTKNPLTPAPTYSAASFEDLPQSSLVGVTVITEWRVGALSKRYSVFSEVTDTAPLEQLVVAEGRVTALKVSTNVPVPGGGTDIVLEAGTVNLDGSVGRAAQAAAAGRGATLSADTTRIDGAGTSVSGPPNTEVSALVDPSDPDLVLGGDIVASMGRTEVSSGSARSSNGLPMMSKSAVEPTLPYTASAVGTHALSFSPGVDLPDMLGLTATQPVVVAEANGGTQARGGGLLETTDGAAHSVKATMSASTDVIRVLPTGFAPEGVVQVRLISSSLVCSASGSAVTAVPTYTAEFRVNRVVDPLSPTPVHAYTEWEPLSSTQSSDPMQAYSLATDTTGWVVGQVGARTYRLGEYLTSMTSQTAASLAALQTIDSSGKRIESGSSAMLSVTTVPLQQAGALSNVTASLGEASCVTQDRR